MCQFVVRKFCQYDEIMGSVLKLVPDPRGQGEGDEGGEEGALAGAVRQEHAWIEAKIIKLEISTAMLEFLSTSSPIQKSRCHK